MWHVTAHFIRWAVLVDFLAANAVSGLHWNGHDIDVRAGGLAKGFTDTTDGDAAEHVATSATAESSFSGAGNGNVTIRGWSRIITSNPDHAKKSAIAKNMTLCVPLVPEDTEKFKKHFVPSLNKQTVKPSELVAALSGVLPEEASHFESSLRGIVKEIPIFVTSVGHKALPGENRNRCVMHSHGDVITFFDADDIMQSRRIEVLDSVFQQFHPNIVIHEFTDNASSLQSVVTGQLEVISAKTAEYNDYATWVSKGVKLAQGWPTASRDVFARVRYNESIREGEDVQLLRDTMQAYGHGETESSVLFVRLPLGFYNSRKHRKAVASKWLKRATAIARASRRSERVD